MTIMHIDMDAFFASVEERDNPSLKGKPIGVIGANTRTVLVTASYEARRYGVRTGMNIPQAKALCPDIILVRANHEKYTQACRQIVKILEGFSPLVEIFSIDEFFLDAAGLNGIFGKPHEMAKRIKERIKKETGLTTSIGIGPNKLIAKLASDLSKPDGLRSIESDEVASVLKDLPVDELCGIGQKTKAALAGMGITTCGELAKADRRLLIDTFGVVGERLIQMGKGEDDSSVISFREEAEEKSMGHSLTLPHDIDDKKELSRHLLRLSDMVAARLRRHGMAGDTVAVTIRYKSFKTFSKQKKIDIPTNHTKRIYDVANQILASQSLKEPVRLIGVSVHNLNKASFVLSLFKEGEERYSRLDRAKDAINDIFGSETVQFASVMDLHKHEKVISPSWRPAGARRY